jgi:hypothetical protein
MNPTVFQHDPALLLEVLLGERQVRHAVALEVEDERQRLAREVVQVRGAVAHREAVRRAAVPLDQVVERARPELLPAVEHHVLEEMRDAGLAARLVARAGAVEDVRRDDGRGVILVHEDAEAVRQRLVGDRQLERADRRCHDEHQQEREEAARHGAPS